MPIFHYQALDRKGRKNKGIIDAPHLTSARSILRGRGLYPRSLKQDAEKRERELFPALTRLLYSVSRRDVAFFARRLGTLLEAGLPLDRSLANVLVQTENDYLKKALIEIRSDIVEGDTLSVAMQKHPSIFPPVYHHLVSVGEKTGTYEKSLLRLAELEESNEKLRSKIVSASIYPVIMLFLLGGILAFLLAVVFPQVKQLFLELDAELPLITKIVIGISDLVTSQWSILLIVAAGIAVYFFLQWKKKSPGREKWEKFVLGLPILGILVQKVLIARFSRNLGVMLESRVPLIAALQVVAKVVRHHIFSAEILDVTEKLKEGKSLSESFQKSSILNIMVLGMLSAGESSDTVPLMVSKVAEVTERDVETSVERASTLLEPIMIMVMGLMIVIIMTAILLPMYSLTNQLQF